VSKYSEMTNEELDKATLGILGWRVEPDSRRPNGFYFYDKNGNLLTHFDKWNPTHPESNQCESYLFPKLRELCSQVLNDNENISFQTHTYLDDDPYYEVSFEKEMEDNNSSVTTGPIVQVSGEQMNPTKVIACLEFMEKLAERSPSP